MDILKRWSWQKLSATIFSPKPTGIDTKINEVKQSLPIPVFWLLGKTQSGKTSLIRALTDNDAAEIGNGFQACTQHSLFYDFPSSSHPIMRFLDTRGLGEINYDASEDLLWCAEQAHLLIVVLRALDMNQAEVVNTVTEIHNQHPEWPIIVLQTCLHEGYPHIESEHIQPYPYRKTPFPGQVPHALAQALLHQRDWFKTLHVYFIPMDLTLPEDGFEAVNYGLDFFWDTVHMLYPQGVISLLRGTEQHKELLNFHARQARPHLLGYALLNTGMGAIPLAGLALSLMVQAKLMHSIASIYDLKLTPRLFSEFTTLLGTGVGIGLLGKELVKLVPIYGSAVAGLYSGAITYALGEAFCVYLNGVKRGALPDQDTLRKSYEQAFSNARQFLKNKES